MFKTRIILFILISINIIWNILLYLNPDKQTFFNYLFNLSYGLIFLFGGIVALMGTRKQDISSKTLQKSFLFYAMAFFSYTIGLCIWTFYNLVLKQPVPYPGVSDLFFILFQPFSALGFIFLLKSYGGEFTSARLIELALLFLIFFGILYSFLLQGSLSEELPLLTRFLSVANPAFDAFLISLAIVGLRTEKGSLHPNLLIFAFAALMMAFADTAFAYRSAQEIYWNGDFADTLYMLAAFLFSLGITSFEI